MYTHFVEVPAMSKTLVKPVISNYPIEIEKKRDKQMHK